MAVWGIFRWFAARRRKRLRRIDMDVLWPICLKGAKDLNHAKMALAVHAVNDPAWRGDYSEEEILEFIDRLEAYD